MVNYANKDYITSLTTASTDGITDGVDHIHSGVIKALEAAARGNYILDYNTASFQQVAGASKTSFGFSAVINYMRDGVVTSADPASVELSSSPHATLTRYDLIVIAADGTLACRTGTENATPTVSALTIGDIPVALVKVEAGTGVNIVTRPIQLYGYNKESNAVSVAYSTGSTYTETLTISGGATGSTIANIVGDLSLTSADDVTVQLGSNDANSIFSITDNEGTPQTQFSVDAAGTVKVPSLTASEIVISDANDNLVSAAVATYPSLTELTYVKGVTSAIQTQLATKLDTAGTGIDISSTTVSVDVSDFMASGANNYVVTALTADTMNAEANLQFDGGTLAVIGGMTATTTASATVGLSTGGTLSTSYEVCANPPAAGTPQVPIPTMTKQVIYSLDHSGGSNTWALPNAISGNIYHIKNIFPTPIVITVAGGETVDLGIHAGNGGTVPCVTALNTFTLTYNQSVTLQGTNDSIVPLQTGWLVIGTA